MPLPPVPGAKLDEASDLLYHAFEKVFFIMQLFRLSSAVLILSTFPFQGAAQNIRVIKFSEGKPFQMGSVTSRRIIHPGLGAKNTTLNYSISKPGAEFAQHVHDSSTDTILVLQGEVNLKQGNSLRLFKAGDFAFVPAGQIHGTVTAGTGEAIMMSFQNPPDLVLYTGARDSMKAGAAPPKGAITPGAVKFLRFADKNGFFTSPEMGSTRAAAAHRKLKPKQSFKTKVNSGGEQLLFVFEGSIQVKDKTGSYTAGEKDTVFVTGPAELEVTAGPSGQTRILQVQAPPSESEK
jgi:quercetin dioxygenase-like cupin family protein